MEERFLIVKKSEEFVNMSDVLHEYLDQTYRQDYSIKYQQVEFFDSSQGTSYPWTFDPTKADYWETYDGAKGAIKNNNLSWVQIEKYFV